MKITLEPIDIGTYPVLQNMARFYVYDLSRTCVRTSADWALPSDGLYESFDFKNYIKDTARRAYFIKVDGELAGFVLLNQHCQYPETKWNMGEFFVMARFQGSGVGQSAVWRIWDQYPGNWEVAVIPENKPARAFWEKTINAYTAGKFIQETRAVDYDDASLPRLIYRFCV